MLRLTRSKQEQTIHLLQVLIQLLQLRLVNRFQPKSSMVHPERAIKTLIFLETRDRARQPRTLLLPGKLELESTTPSNQTASAVKMRSLRMMLEIREVPIDKRVPGRAQYLQDQRLSRPIEESWEPLITEQRDFLEITMIQMLGKRNKISLVL